MRQDARKIYTGAIHASLPDSAVSDALKRFTLPEGRLILVAIGKAAYRMAKRARDIIVDEMCGKIDTGIVITKYNHREGDIPELEIYEGGHPVPDENCVRATERALEITEDLNEKDTVLMLISGGGSSLFECPYCDLSDYIALTKALLGSGADIREINTVRKHLSRVKGGRFAEHIGKARLFTVALSDVLGNRLDTIASGPTVIDNSTADEANAIIGKYKISISEKMREHLSKETPKKLPDATQIIGGSVSELCLAAKAEAEALGYKVYILTDAEEGEAREVGRRLAAMALENQETKTPLAFIIGGETVVKLKGNGLGGRNQEIALAAAPLIRGKDNIAIFSVGSDGTDGPTDAAGGYVDGESYDKMVAVGLSPEGELENNNAYYALKSIDGLIMTGPTGTNVNDFCMALIRVK